MSKLKSWKNLLKGCCQIGLKGVERAKSNYLLGEAVPVGNSFWNIRMFFKKTFLSAYEIRNLIS